MKQCSGILSGWVQYRKNIPNTLQKIEDITGKINDETKALESAGGKFIVTDEISFSSSKLLLTVNIITNKDQNFFLKKFV